MAGPKRDMPERDDSMQKENEELRHEVGRLKHLEAQVEQFRRRAEDLEQRRVPQLEEALTENREFGKHGPLIEVTLKYRDGYEISVQTHDPRPPDLDEGQEPVVAKAPGEAVAVGEVEPTALKDEGNVAP